MTDLFKNNSWIGQKKLLSSVSNFTLETLPKALLFIGPYGCGKNTIINYLAERLNLFLEEISTNICTDDLIEISQKTVPTIYKINLKNFNENQQNQFLKFIEEPSSSTFIMLTAESEVEVLPTILNRCKKIYFENYTEEDLIAFSKNNSLDIVESSYIFKICNTPGSLLLLNKTKFSELVSFCNSFLNYLPTLSYPKVISTASFINYKDLYDKFDFELFFKVLEVESLKMYKETNNNIYFIVCNLINKFRVLRLHKNIIKETFMLNFLTQLYKEIH